MKSSDFWEGYTQGIVDGRSMREIEIIALLENKQLEMTLPDGTIYIEFRVLHDIIDAIKGESK